MSGLADQPQILLSSEEAIQELSEEQSEVVKGGVSGTLLKKVKDLRRTDSAPGRLERVPFHDSRPTSPASSTGSGSGGSTWSRGSYKEFLRIGTSAVRPV